jgi:hypothetical protein
MKAQKIMLGILIALVVAVIVIQLVVKQKVTLDNGSTGTAGVLARPSEPEIMYVEQTENV